MRFHNYQIGKEVAYKFCCSLESFEPLLRYRRDRRLASCAAVGCGPAESYRQEEQSVKLIRSERYRKVLLCKFSITNAPRRFLHSRQEFCCFCSIVKMLAIRSSVAPIGRQCVRNLPRASLSVSVQVRIKAARSWDIVQLVSITLLIVLFILVSTWLCIGQ